MATNRKIQKKIWLENLRFEILPYPKGDNSNYKLGTFLKPKVININDLEENNDV